MKTLDDYGHQSLGCSTDPSLLVFMPLYISSSTTPEMMACRFHFCPLIWETPAAIPWIVTKKSPVWPGKEASKQLWSASNHMTACKQILQPWSSLQIPMALVDSLAATWTMQLSWSWIADLRELCVIMFVVWSCYVWGNLLLSNQRLVQGLRACNLYQGEKKCRGIN